MGWLEGSCPYYYQPDQGCNITIANKVSTELWTLTTTNTHTINTAYKKKQIFMDSLFT